MVNFRNYPALSHVDVDSKSASRAVAFLFTAVVILASLCSCTGSNKDDSLSLLSAVPADAETVALVNVNTLVSQTGGKVKNGKIVDPGSLREYAGTVLKPHDARMAEWLVSPDSGLDPTSVVVFMTKGKPVFCALVADEAELCRGVDSLWPGEWEEVDGVRCKDGLAVLKGRFWIMDGVAGRDAASEARRFMGLSEVESFRSNPVAVTMAERGDAVSAYGTIDSMMKVSGMSFTDQTMLRMGLGMCFDSPRAVGVWANVKGECIEATAQILDKDGKSSKCTLELSKIDTAQVAALGGNVNLAGAVAVSKKLVGQIMKLASSFGGEMPQGFADALSSVDGTVAFAASREWTDELTGPGGFRGSVQTSGADNAMLLQTMQSLGLDVKAEGKLFTFGQGNYGNGIMPMAGVAKEFEGAWVGVASAFEMPEGHRKGVAYITLRPENSSLVMETKICLK